MIAADLKPVWDSTHAQRGRADIAGWRFGLLVAVREAGRIGGLIHWLCNCDCGNTKLARTFDLRRGSVASCGCLRKRPPGEASARALFRQYRRNARRRGVFFALSLADFRPITQGDCHYCGMPPSRESLAKANSNGAFICNGIDRMDSSIGYIASNCVPCCADCNRAKSNVPYPLFVAWLDRVAAHRK